MSKAYQRENSWGKGGRMKGYALVKKLKKKRRNCDWRASNAATECNAMQCSNETQMEVPESCLPQLSSHGRAEPVFWRSWQCVSVLSNGCDAAGDSRAHACLAGCKPTASEERVPMTGYVQWMSASVGHNVQTSPCPGVTKTEHLVWVHTFIFQSNPHRWNGLLSDCAQEHFLFMERENSFSLIMTTLIKKLQMCLRTILGWGVYPYKGHKALV